MSGLLLIIALSGPSWKDKQVPALENSSALVIALDLSRSMNASDQLPSRLQRAKFKIYDILNLRKEGETALIAYAGDAFTVSPLTDDVQTINAQLPALTPDIMPVQGNNLRAALQESIDLLLQAEHSTGDILLITDDVNGADDLELFKEAAQHGFRTSILGVGTIEGAPVPVGNRFFTCLLYTSPSPRDS